MRKLGKRTGSPRHLAAILITGILCICGLAFTSAPVPIEVTAAPNFIQPGEPPAPEITLQDTDSSLLAREKRVAYGDNFLESLYERPFSSIEMAYYPDVDIQTATVSADDHFFYFTITLKSVDPSVKKLTGSYGIEIDRGLKGRGDLVWGRGMGADWSTDTVAVYADPDKDVGGLNPLIANEWHIGDGYETKVAYQGDMAAYARLAPGDPQVVQFAVNRALLDGAEKFLWGAWADRGWQNPGRFEYNDFIGPGAAGSPIKYTNYYPVKDLYGLDNTCRRAYGFAPDYMIRGMCISR